MEPRGQLRWWGARHLGVAPPTPSHVDLRTQFHFIHTQASWVSKRQVSDENHAQQPCAPREQLKQVQTSSTCHFHSLFFGVTLFFTKKLNGFGEIKCEWLGLISLGC